MKKIINKFFKKDDDKIDALPMIFKKLDDIDLRLSGIDKTLIKQEGNLELHMQRSNHLEKLVEINTESMKPISKHISRMEGALKLLGVIALVVGVASGLARIFGVI